MNILDQIEALSRRDTKTLSQKGLKACEEAGELAKAILPLDSAHGTNHRTPRVDKVVEECADMILVAYSIAASLDVSREEFLKVIKRKTDYWEFLLDNEDQVDVNNLHFEIHITIRNADRDKFVQDCLELSVKPIILDLYNDQEVIADIMTSSKFVGTTTSAMRYCRDLAQSLRELGHEVVREKIETVPWHPAARIKDHHDDRYFEAHLAFVNPDMDDLSEFSKTHNIHMSRNTMKKDSRSVLMGTYRISAQSTTPEDFIQHIDDLCLSAQDIGLVISSRPHTEYSLYDDNQRHDSDWINS